MEKKYTIFVSSTYKDLQNERQTVANIILELEHIPVGMELFSAADEPSWEIIKQQLDLSDYLVLVLAHRYGSELDNVGFVEREYDYAIAHDIPVVPLFQDGTSWDIGFTDSDPEKKEKLGRFKERVRTSHQIVQWSDAADLGRSVMAGLIKQMKRTPRAGWIRGNQVVGAEVLNEVVRLSEENARLRETSSADARFSLIDAMAEEVMCQAVIYMFESGRDLPRHAKYIYGYASGASGAGQLGGTHRNGLDAAGITRAGGGGRMITLTEEGKKFADWLISKRRKCAFFRTEIGGWGTVDVSQVDASWVKGIDLGNGGLV